MNHAPAASMRRQDIKQYLASSFLPEPYTFWLNVEEGILTMMDTRECIPILQQLLSPGESFVMKGILEQYPDYCPYEQVLHVMTGKSIEQCRENVNWGIENHSIDAVLRPVRNLMGRVRMKLHPFGIDVKSLINTGYLIVPLDKKQRSRD